MNYERLSKLLLIVFMAIDATPNNLFGGGASSSMSVEENIVDEKEQIQLNRDLLRAAYTNDVTAAAKALAGGADINAQDDNKNTSLHHATGLCHLEVLEFLLKNRPVIDVDAKSLWTNPPAICC